MTLLSISLSAVGQAQSRPSALAVESLLTAREILPEISTPTFAPDEQHFAFAALDRRPERLSGAYRTAFDGLGVYIVGSDIWLASTHGDVSARNLTEGKNNSWGPSWSPDGRRLAFFSDGGSGGRRDVVHLWLWERIDGTLRQVSNVYIRISPLTILERPEWTADGRNVLVSIHPESSFDDNHAEPHSETGVTATVFSFDPMLSDSLSKSMPGDLKPWERAAVRDLAVVNVETGAVLRLTRGAQVYDRKLSPSRRRVAWVAVRGFVRPGSEQLRTDLMVTDISTGRTRRLVADVPLVHPPGSTLMSWAPNEESLAYRLDGPEIKDGLHVVSTADGRSRKIAEEPVRYEPGTWMEEWRHTPPLWDRTGRVVYYIRQGVLWRARTDGGGAAAFATATDRDLDVIGHSSGEIWSPDSGLSTIAFTTHRQTKQMGFARINLTSGKITSLLEEAKYYSPSHRAVVTPAGDAVAYVAQDARHPPDLWLVPGSGAVLPRRLTEVAPELRGIGNDGGADILTWHGLDGDTLEGALILPAGYQPGTRYPLLVYVYGGADLSRQLHYFGYAPYRSDNLHVFSSRGYAVLLAGSRLHVGSPKLDLVKSVLPGVNRAIEIGVADPSRLGLIGSSYGGYSTLALITQTSRFKTAVMRAGFGDLIGLYGLLSPRGSSPGADWAETGQGRMGSTPWEARERYVENSPIFYLDRVHTPLLIIHGDSDTAVPFSLADQVFVGLRRLGKRVEYARYAGEDHHEGEWALPNQLDYLRRVIAWFDHHLKPSELTAESVRK